MDFEEYCQKLINTQKRLGESFEPKRALKAKKAKARVRLIKDNWGVLVTNGADIKQTSLKTSLHCIKQNTQKEYYQKNRAKILDSRKENYHINPGKKKEYYLKNRDSRITYQKKYREKHRNKDKKVNSNNLQ